MVGVDDALPQILWFRYFIESQGYKIDENVLFQDNKSAILLEKNGKTSNSKKTKHIRVRYFFIQDRVNHREVSIKYCPTEQMWSDMLTEPLDGQQFKMLREMVMNCPVDYDSI